MTTTEKKSCVSNRIQVQVRIRNTPSWQPQKSKWASLPNVSKHGSNLPNNSLSKGELCMELLPPNGIKISDPDPQRGRPMKDFAFDSVFSPTDSQESVYNHAAKDLIENVLKGYNGCIFAYGQTASGKTYTMQGPDGYAASSSVTDRGLIYRAVEQITKHISSLSGKSIYDPTLDEKIRTEFSVKASFLEIYQETLKDLLCDDGAQGSIFLEF